jgi:very-short-patch-repair endonuclease
MREQETTDALIAALAASQYGVVSRDDLRRIGIPRGAIDRRIAASRLLPLHRGVYAVGHRAPRPEARWLAAVLAGGDDAVLSHRSAGALWAMIDREAGAPEITVRTRRRTAGVLVHRGRLTPADRAAHRGIPVTSPARTLADLAHVLDAEGLTRAVREAQFRRLVDIPSVLDALQRRPAQRLRVLLDAAAPTQSVLEDRLLAICHRHRIPRPLTQQTVAGRRVDFLWPDQRLVVETDGFEGHGTASAFQRDRATDNALQLAGYTVLRFTNADVTRRQAAVARQIRQALDASEVSRSRLA